MQYNLNRNGREFELEVEYHYDFEHRVIDEDSLTFDLHGHNVDKCITPEEYWQAYSACLELERSSAKRWCYEDDGRW